MPDYKEQLNTARQYNQNTLKTPGAAKKAISDSLSLAKYIDPFMDWLYGIALALAILKDVLDYLIIGVFFGPIISFFIFFIMFITGSFSQARWARRVGVLILGTMLELLFGVDFLPIESLIVILVFYMTLKSRAQAAYQKSLQENLAIQEAYAA